MSDTASTPNPAPLDYASRKERRRITWRGRALRTIGIVLAIVLVYEGWQWRKEIRGHANLLLIQRQCMNYVPGPGRIVFSTDPSVVNQPGYSKMWDWGPFAREFDPNTAVFRPDIYNRFRSISRLPADTNPLAFLGELRTPSGHVRLVAVTIHMTVAPAYRGTHFGELIFPVEVYEPATFTQRAVLLPSQASPKIDLGKNPFTVYAGQRNPVDPSAFSIRVQIQGQQTQFIDGRIDHLDAISLGWRK